MLVALELVVVEDRELEGPAGRVTCGDLELLCGGRVVAVADGVAAVEGTHAGGDRGGRLPGAAERGAGGAGVLVDRRHVVEEEERVVVLDGDHRPTVVELGTVGVEQLDHEGLVVLPDLVGDEGHVDVLGLDEREGVTDVERALSARHVIAVEGDPPRAALGLPAVDGHLIRVVVGSGLRGPGSDEVPDADLVDGPSLDVHGNRDGVRVPTGVVLDLDQVRIALVDPDPGFLVEEVEGLEPHVVDLFVDPVDLVLDVILRTLDEFVDVFDGLIDILLTHRQVIDVGIIRVHAGRSLDLVLDGLLGFLNLLLGIDLIGGVAVASRVIRIQGGVLPDLLLDGLLGFADILLGFVDLILGVDARVHLGDARFEDDAAAGVVEHGELRRRHDHQLEELRAAHAVGAHRHLDRDLLAVLDGFLALIVVVVTVARAVPGMGRRQILSRLCLPADRMVPRTDHKQGLQADRELDRGAGCAAVAVLHHSGRGLIDDHQPIRSTIRGRHLRVSGCHPHAGGKGNQQRDDRHECQPPHHNRPRRAWRTIRPSRGSRLPSRPSSWPP